MTGQDVVNVASAFAEQVDFDGVIMSKTGWRCTWWWRALDQAGHGQADQVHPRRARSPIRSRQFHPDRMAKRILGMGDVISLIETASQIRAEEIEQEEAERMMRADLNSNDFRCHQQAGAQDRRHPEARECASRWR